MAKFEPWPAPPSARGPRPLQHSPRPRFTIRRLSPRRSDGSARVEYYRLHPWWVRDMERGATYMAPTHSSAVAYVDLILAAELKTVIEEPTA